MNQNIQQTTPNYWLYITQSYLSLNGEKHQLKDCNECQICLIVQQELNFLQETDVAYQQALTNYQNFYAKVKTNDLLLLVTNIDGLKYIKAIAKVIRFQDNQKLLVDMCYTFSSTKYLPSFEGRNLLNELPTLSYCKLLNQSSTPVFHYALTAQDFTLLYHYIEQHLPSSCSNQPLPPLSTLTTPIKIKPYTAKDLLAEVYISKQQLQQIMRILNNELNIVLEGAPGVGKSFLAKRLVYLLLGTDDPKTFNNYCSVIEFSPSYTQQDFMYGYRPNGMGIELTDGAFVQICKRAQADIDNKYFVIIEEFNRGHTTDILGEAFTLIEKSHRGESIYLSNKQQLFTIPSNLYIIGTMNTADRNLALMDLALLRRFAFYELVPNMASTEITEQLIRKIDHPNFTKFMHCLAQINQQIANDQYLGTGFCIGYGIFDSLDPKYIRDSLEDIIITKIRKLLQKCWPDNPDLVSKQLQELMLCLK